MFEMAAVLVCYLDDLLFLEMGAMKLNQMGVVQLLQMGPVQFF